MNDLAQYGFYEDLVRKLRSRGVICAITSGLACVHFGIAESTKDCDLLCHRASFGALLELLGETSIEGVACRYRGSLSPPLDARWHAGGWTSHFEWPAAAETVTLDVFGQAVRQSSPWEEEVAGLYAGMQVVAEMKRTDREKDWPFVTLLGIRMLAARDPRGWLHLFDEDALVEASAESAIPDECMEVRPVLALARERHPMLGPALFAERVYWQQLDRLRIRIYRAALRPYVAAVAGGGGPGHPTALSDDHTRRVRCAEATLAPRPLAAHGLNRFLDEARAATGALVNPEAMRWLPDVRPHFKDVV